MLPATERIRVLLHEWRAEAATVRRRYADESKAHLLTVLADELEEALSEGEETLLNLTQAAQESGYTAGQLRRMIRSGNLTDYGRNNAPRVKRADLPLKPGRLRTGTSPVQLAYADRQTTRSIVDAIA
jgi:hypothetical protein